MRIRVLAATLVFVAATWGAWAAGGQAAGAAVVHRTGFTGTVAGWRSWYGSYDIAGIGTVWCVDHGIPAPDGGFAYRPAALGERAPDTRRAMAWAVSRHGPGATAVDAAALELTLHDLMGARYPHGVLHVDALRPSDLRGFGGHEAEIVARAVAFRADALGHAHLTSPLTLDATTQPVRPGDPATIAVFIHDGNGAGVAGVDVAVGGATVVTDEQGRAAVTAPATDGNNQWEAHATVPDLELHSFAPRRAVAQRVAQPASIDLHAGSGFTALPTRVIRIRKTGDDLPYLGVAGAAFRVAGQTVATDAGGLAPPVRVQPGVYQVDEVSAPFGYETAGPWSVDTTAGDAALEVADHSMAGTVSMGKVDAATGAPVAGATLALRFDHDHDGSFETEIVRATTGLAAFAQGGLLPGDYQVVEVDPPPGYRTADAPVPVHVDPGAVVDVAVRDRGFATVTFAKTPPVEGATFAVVSPADGHELGRCTTDAAGRCGLPADALDTTQRVCWREVVAPPGFDAAVEACLTTGGPGSVTEVAVAEPRTPVPVPPPPPPSPPPASPPAAVVAAAVIRRPAVVAGELPATGADLPAHAAAGLASIIIGTLFVRAARPARCR